MKKLIIAAFLLTCVSAYSVGLSKKCLGDWKVDLKATEKVFNKDPRAAKMPDKMKVQMLEMLKKTKVKITKSKLTVNTPHMGAKTEEYSVTKASKGKYSLKFKDGSKGNIKLSGKSLYLDLYTKSGRKEMQLVLKK